MSEWFQASYRSLVGLIQKKRSLNNEMDKRKKGFKMAMMIGGILIVIYILFFFLFGMRYMRKDTMIVALILCGVVIVVFLPIYLFTYYNTIVKPQKDFFKMAEKTFPGIDTSTETSIKSYLWNLKDREFLYNLEPLIVWEGASRNKEYDPYAPNERIVLDVWRTNNIDRELYDYYHHKDHEISYLEGVINSFYTIKADEEARLWAKVINLLERIQIIDYDKNLESFEEKYIYSINGIDGEARFACEEEDKNVLNDLKEKLKEVREDTERKLYQYVLENKIMRESL